ncbi:hypothetical protein PV328_011758 [Microctonus aethiopoides]|uniref:Exonuclease domain-containing protein n=1 Tax=Microctonus aethiopoides TaxID=144406 RepID=A0AA39EZT5_9HYME|nr:hypothetical protein PV328_011758 [Microctonus aethiopoides]
MCLDTSSHPKEVAEEIHSYHKILVSAGNSMDDNNNKHAMSDSNNESTRFDLAVGEVVNIIVSYDMGWSKHGNGRSYDSLNGYGTIIRFLSGKILDYADRIRKCRFCVKGRSKEDHNCRKNFQESAKTMEPDAGAALINDSKIFKEANLAVRVVFGDEDSSAIAAFRRGTVNSMFKFADGNHLKKNFSRDLHGLNYKELKPKKTVKHVKKCFSYAIAQNTGNAKNLASALRNVPGHLFNSHDNCGTWCNRKNASTQQTVILKNSSLYNELSGLFNSLSESSSFRLASLVCVKNDGESSISEIRVQYQSNLGFSESLETSDNFDDSQLETTQIKITSETCNLVYFDLETSGFSKNDEILQIAASCEGRKFSIYINPTKRIDDKASFSNLSSKPCVLVAHNVSFDKAHLLRAILKFSMVQKFSKIAGYSDSLSLFKKHFSVKKVSGEFKLSTLAAEHLNVTSEDRFHEAMYDVDILEQLLALTNKDHLFENSKSYRACLNHLTNLKMIASAMQDLSPLKGVVSNHICQKMASGGIKYSCSLNKYQSDGTEKFKEYLKNPGTDKKAQISKDKRVIDKLVKFFEAIWAIGFTVLAIVYRAVG